MQGLFKTVAVAAIIAATLSGCQNASTDGVGGILDGFSKGKNSQVEIGQREFGRQNYGLSEKAFRKAVEKRPGDADGWLGLAASYDQLGQFKRADRAYDQLKKLSGENVVVLNNKGYSLILRGDVRKGIEMLERASELAPEAPLVKGNLQYGYEAQ